LLFYFIKYFGKLKNEKEKVERERIKNETFKEIMNKK